MSAKKIVVIVLSSTLALILGFCTFWVINNFDAIKYAMSGSALYTKSDLDKAYEDGYNAAGYDVKDLNDIITGLRSDLDTKSAELKKVKSDYNNLLKNYNDLEDLTEEEKAELNATISVLNREITELEKEIYNLNISLQSYEEIKAQLEAENKVIATFIYDDEVVFVKGYEKGSKMESENIPIPKDTDERKFEGWMVNGEDVDITDYTINENTVFTANIGYYAKNWVLRASSPNDMWLEPSCLWTDGNNLYYSLGDSQYVLNKETSTWEEKTWNGLERLNGLNIWSDGENIYYSEGISQYVLNKETSTWEEKTWNGLEYFNGLDIWSDGENIYLASTYVLNKETSTWEGCLGSMVILDEWTDGINIYKHEDGSDFEKIHYIFNEELSIWQEITDWEITTFEASHVVNVKDKTYVLSYENSSLYEFCPVKISD